MKMNLYKSFIKLFPFLWLLLYQISSTLCASLEIQNYSLKSFNFSNIQSNRNSAKNLSELIEFSAEGLPAEIKNASVFHQGNKEQTTPKIITVKLKTHVLVGNQGNNSETGEVSEMDPNASETPLSEIEYVDSEENENFDFLEWKSYRRTARMTSLADEKEVPKSLDRESNTYSEEDNSDENNLSSKESEETENGKALQRSKYAKGRQFVFHPYLPYGKDVPPDEKISFHDILPLKAVKFIKSMVEDADWNGMFKSMVRTVVDHFVNKIIEKMFSEKDDPFKKRSLDVQLSPTFVFPNYRFPTVRLKRSASTSNFPDQSEDIFNLPSKRKSQELEGEGKKSPEERMSWLDLFLDYVFPNSKSDKYEEEPFDGRLKKRDTASSELVKILIDFFVNTFEKSSEFMTDAKDALRYKMLKEFLPYLYKNRYIHPDSSTNSIDMKMTHRNNKFTKNILKRNDIADHITNRSGRSKRSTRGHSRKDEDRLWQSHSRRHRPHRYNSRDECSLRRACNAGRLLSRIPSVEDITLQLRSSGNEPHWDALIWGMKKKRCSRIYCKRQRSPKGSKYLWNSGKERLSKTVEIVTEPPVAFGETENSTL